MSDSYVNFQLKARGRKIRAQAWVSSWYIREKKELDIRSGSEKKKSKTEKKRI